MTPPGFFCFSFFAFGGRTRTKSSEGQMDRRAPCSTIQMKRRLSEQKRKGRDDRQPIEDKSGEREKSALSCSIRNIQDGLTAW